LLNTRVFNLLIFISLSIILVACNNNSNLSANPPAESLVYYNWEDDIPIEVLDEFTARTGISVEYQTFESSQEAENNLQNGAYHYDVLAVETDSISRLVANQLVAELNYDNIPNAKFVSNAVHSPTFDQDKVYSVPFDWGSTGLIVLQDNNLPDLKAWKDLWNTSDWVTIGMRENMPYDNFAMAKKGLGYSINDCDPGVLYSAFEELKELSPRIKLVDVEAGPAIDLLESGEIDILIGWSDDITEAKDRGLAVKYILPEEGTFLWGDSYVVSASTDKKKQAEQLINFLLEPEIAAKIMIHSSYASTNSEVNDFLPSYMIYDTTIFPTREGLINAESYIPLEASCTRRILELWDVYIQGFDS